jgi:exopolysaccharide production protein ExoQ
MRLGFSFGLIFVMSAFVRQLAVDPNTLQFTSSRILQAVTLFCAVYGFAMIVSSREVATSVLRCWPSLVLYGLALLSAVWSYNPAATFRASNVFLTTTLFSLAMAGRLSPAACLQLIIRTMTFVCLLSIIWVILFPQETVHQSTDPYQFVHAGLWRGIFSHKQALGLIAGLTTGLLLFYGSMTFASPIVRAGAIICSVACLVGTQSATGFLLALIISSVLYITYWIARRDRPLRKGPMGVLVITTATLYACFNVGLFNFIMPLLGKSTDLTGRADVWPWVIANIQNSGSALLGGGFGSGWEEVVAESVSVDNGYIDLLISFGYFGAAFVLCVYGLVIWHGIKLIISGDLESAAVRIFPFSIMLVQLIVNITEPTFMAKNIFTVLVTVAVYQVMRKDKVAQDNIPAPRPRPLMR